MQGYPLPKGLVLTPNAAEWPRRVAVDRADSSFSCFELTCPLPYAAQPEGPLHLPAIGDQAHYVSARYSWEEIAGFLRSITPTFQPEDAQGLFVIPPDLRDSQAREYRELVQ